MPDNNGLASHITELNPIEPPYELAASGASECIPFGGNPLFMTGALSVDAGPDATHSSGILFERQGSFSIPDGSILVSVQGAIVFGDGPTIGSFNIDQSSRTFALSHAFEDPGVFKVEVHIGAVLSVAGPFGGIWGACDAFYVTVPDTDDHEAPVIATPSALIIPNDAGQASAATDFMVSATDNVDGMVPVECNPPSGSFFPVGTTTVVCMASDSSGNLASAQFNVTVFDDEAPTITVPGTIALANEAGQAGAVVSFNVTATDNVDGTVSVNCTPPSGSFFPIGITTVICTAADAAGKIAHTTFDVTVFDDEAPVIEIPADITVFNDPNQAGAIVSFSVTATDNWDVSVPVQCNPPSGSFFPVGTTTVVCSATDRSGHLATATFNVTCVRPRVFVFFFTGFLAAEYTDGVPSGMARLRTTLQISQLPSNIVLAPVFGWDQSTRYPPDQLGFARTFVIEFLESQSAGPRDAVVLVGHSFGGHIAYRMAQDAAGEGKPAKGLITFDPIDWTVWRPDQSSVSRPSPSGVPLANIHNFVQRNPKQVFRYNGNLKGYAINGADNNSELALGEDGGKGTKDDTTHNLIDDDASGGKDGRPGKANIDDNGNGTKDDYTEILWPGTDDRPLGIYTIVVEILRNLATDSSATIAFPVVAQLSSGRSPRPMTRHSIPDATSVDRVFSEVGLYPGSALAEINEPMTQPFKTTKKNGKSRAGDGAPQDSGESVDIQLGDNVAKSTLGSRNPFSRRTSRWTRLK